MWSAVVLHQVWTQIKQLDLSNCKIINDSINALLKVEWINVTLLWLNNNQIGDLGIIKILNKKWKLNILQLYTYIST